jgi:hypothetical protein
MWIAVQKWGYPLMSFWSCLDAITTCYTIFKQCQNPIHTGYPPVKCTVLQKCQTVWLWSHIHTVHHVPHHSNTASWFQFCMPRMNIHTADHNEAYLNKTDYHTVKHHSWRNCNIPYTVQPNDVTKSISEESKHDRWYCIHKPTLHNRKLPLPFS